eukprot:5431973-Pleurochrysis_carterae.AAC.6
MSDRRQKGSSTGLLQLLALSHTRALNASTTLAALASQLKTSPHPHSRVSTSAAWSHATDRETVPQLVGCRRSSSSAYRPNGVR